MQTSNSGETTNHQYKGVSGWLMLLCVGMTILGPLRNAVALVQGYGESSTQFDRFPGLKTIVLLDDLLSLALIAFSIYAGSRLWQIKPGAVQTAKKFLLCVLAYTVIASVLPFLAGLPPEATSAIFSEVMKGVIQSVIGVAIWYSYLNKSKRVKATYPDAA